MSLPIPEDETSHAFWWTVRIGTKYAHRTVAANVVLLDRAPTHAASYTELDAKKLAKETEGRVCKITVTVTTVHAISELYLPEDK